MPRNSGYANKGKQLESAVCRQNQIYAEQGIALVQKIHTAWTPIRRDGKIVSSFVKEKSTVDFRGTVGYGIPVSFDCKETNNEKGLPLADIRAHQIGHMRMARNVGETIFILCADKEYNVHFINGESVIIAYDKWQANKGRRGINLIPFENMIRIGHVAQRIPYADYIISKKDKNSAYSAQQAVWTYGDDQSLICSVCQHECPEGADGRYLDISYCPYCGSKMD